MIYVKTKMKRIPKTCSDCFYYESGWVKECTAIKMYMYNDPDLHFHPYKQRHDKCPLGEES